jgi:hypothetical protein
MLQSSLAVLPSTEDINTLKKLYAEKKDAPSVITS